MAIPRERSSIATRNGGNCGRFTWYPNYGPGDQINSARNFVRDSVGPEDNYPLDVEHHDYSGGTVNQQYGGYFSSWFHNWVPEILRSGFNLSHLSTNTDAIADPDYATQAVARTNPSRPYVDLPVELLQLPEIAQLAHPSRQSGLSSQLGNQYLMTSFGVMPVAQAIARLTRSHQIINDRVKEIRRLVAYGIKRTVEMDVGVATAAPYWYIDTAHSTMGGTFNVSTVSGVRCHVRWGLYPGAFSGHETPSQMNAQIADWARRSALGLTIDPSTVWQITPWSWLCDWFLGIGDYLKSQRNIVPALLKEVTVMRRFRTVASYPGISYDPGGGAKRITIDPIRMVRDSKHRRFSYPSPFTAHLPLLDSGRAATIASLAATR